MKLGDLVDTPHGPGKFFSLKEGDETKALVRLKDPKDGAVWHPLVDAQPVWECVPCNEVPVEDVTVTKTAEQLEQEFINAQKAAHAQKQAQMEEAFRRMNAQQQQRT